MMSSTQRLANEMDFEIEIDHMTGDRHLCMTGFRHDTINGQMIGMWLTIDEMKHLALLLNAEFAGETPALVKP